MQFSKHWQVLIAVTQLSVSNGEEEANTLFYFKGKKEYFDY